MLHTSHPLPHQPFPFPLYLDGLGGQEDELDDVSKGILEPTPGDISSGASNRERKVDPSNLDPKEQDVDERPVPEQPGEVNVPPEELESMEDEVEGEVR